MMNPEDRENLKQQVLYQLVKHYTMMSLEEHQRLTRQLLQLNQEQLDEPLEETEHEEQELLAELEAMA